MTTTTSQSSRPWTVAVSLILACLLATATSRASDQIPGAPQAGPIALVGGTIHTVSGKVIKGGTILFEQGRITAIGDKLELPEGTEQVDVAGKQIYPALFDSYSSIGLVEINAVRATRDEAETGNLNPNVRAEVSVNPDSELIPVARSNGVLLALSAPSGGLISGQSAVLQLDGWTYEDLTVKSRAAMHIRWPTMSPVSDWWVEASAKEQMATRDKQLKLLEDTFLDAQHAWRASQDPAADPLDIRVAAMVPMLAGKQPVVVTANSVSQIQAAVAFAVRHKLRLVILGGYDAIACVELLKRHDVPVIVGGVYRLPQRRDDDYDAAYTLPERLRKAGITYCIASNGRFGASNIRNLPYHAATAVAYGLPEAEALKAITLYPAQILGVGEQVGSLAVGRDATLFVSSGDPLETSSRVQRAYVQGRLVDLSSKHKQLFQKYRTKYQQQADAEAGEGQ
jgi:imidazolonepropionase-like amidohydrolase